MSAGEEPEPENEKVNVVEFILLEAGWEKWPTSCRCGGNEAWFRPVENGMRSWGCVCHNTPTATQLIKMIIHGVEVA